MDPPDAPAFAAGLEAYAGVLWDPIIALLTALSRLSGLPLTAGQRSILSSMFADMESIAQRAEGLVMSPGEAAPVHAALAPDPLERPLGAARPTVLVVDDDLVWLETARELLARCFNILTAADGCEAMELLTRHHPDAVVSDLSMPRTGGLALLEHARGSEETAHIPFLVLSATTDTETKVQAFQAGAFDYLTKPVSPGELVVRIRNALEHSQALRRERLLQETDDLTGLPNRRALRSVLGSALREAGRAGQPLALVMVDQDNLKRINDRYGHPVGDEAIRTVSGALQRCKRASDFAARLGGDEFVVVMPGAERSGAEKLVARVQADLIQQPLDVPGVGSVPVAASFGVAVVGEAGRNETWEQLLQRADASLYRHKAESKAREVLRRPPKLRMVRAKVKGT